MAGYLAQQRHISFIVGGATGAFLFISTKNLLWNTALSTSEALPGSRQWKIPEHQAIEQEKLFGPGARAVLIRRWNQTVDAVSKPVMKALVDRNL